MKILILSLLMLLSPLAVSAEGDKLPSKPILKRQFRAQSVSESAELSVLILGPESVPAGTLVVLDASKTVGDTFSWKLAGGSSELYQVSDDGKKVYFASPSPGTYPFLLAVAKKNGDKVPLLVIAEHKIIVQGATPKPDKPDIPNPVTPTDPLDVGKYGISRYIRDLVREKIPSDKRGTASGFSVNYTLVASGLKNKTISGFNAALLDAKNKNQATAGTAIADWRDSVFVPLGNKINELITSKVLDTSNPASLVDLFSEIGLGFAASVGN